MQVMTRHTFFDEDIECVMMNSNYEVREIILREGNEGSLLINKHDAIALAKEFGLVIFEKKSIL